MMIFLLSHLQLHSTNFSMSHLRLAYDNMVTDVVMGDHARLRHVLRFRYRLTAALFLPLFRCFCVVRSLFQLYLAGKGGKFGL